MTLSSRNLLKVYGDEDRRDVVGGVVTAIFGECIPDLARFASDATTGGSLLAAVRFDWPGEPPVGWVEELSRRMPGEAFELYSDPAPAAWAPDCRVIIRGGRRLDGVGFGDTGWLNRNLPLSASPLKEPALAAQGPLDLVAIAVATLDRYHGYIYDDMVCPLHWKEHYEMHSLGSQVCSLETLLTPDEDSRVAPQRALHEARSRAVMDCQRFLANIPTGDPNCPECGGEGWIRDYYSHDPDDYQVGRCGVCMPPSFVVTSDGIRQGTREADCEKIEGRWVRKRRGSAPPECKR